MPPVEFGFCLPFLSPSTEKVIPQSVQGAFVQMRPQTVSIAFIIVTAICKHAAIPHSQTFAPSLLLVFY